jgi:hypothetical protein
LEYKKPKKIDIAQLFIEIVEIIRYNHIDLSKNVGKEKQIKIFAKKEKWK